MHITKSNTHNETVKYVELEGNLSRQKTPTKRQYSAS